MKAKVMKQKVQSLGGFLTAMILPNIGAFIAWGLLTAMFMSTGWFPNENFALLKDPILKYLLPLLVGYTGGDLVYKKRGGVMGAVLTMGCIVGTDITMLAGAMILGPIGGLVIKKFDKLIDGKIPSGFEMLVNNFSIGIIGMLLCLVTFSIAGPIFEGLNTFFSSGVQWLMDKGLMILYPIFMEPARMLFLNNAISQGIFAPLGVEQAAEAGKSIFFLLSSNPGPGLGLLLAYWLYGKGTAKEAAPSAMIIHFFGGIHEMYFPYVLMKPKLIIATIAGWMGGYVTFNLVGAGLIAYPSPGSIISYMLMTPKGDYLLTLSGVVVATVISFLLSMLILKLDKSEEEDFQSSISMMEGFKGKKSKYFDGIKAKAGQEGDNAPAADTAALAEEQETAAPEDKKLQEKNENGIRFTGPVHKIIFACDAGMGSSAMGASVLRKKVQAAGLDIEVANSAIEQIPADADVIVCHEGLYDRAKSVAPNGNFVVITNFLSAPEYEELIARLKENQQ
ncbi:MAG: PTS mannitol transporter subunit IICB [Candidatus Merdisoma sp.]|jgi:PTS system mannitol-specific IIC component